MPARFSYNFSSPLKEVSTPAGRTFSPPAELLLSSISPSQKAALLRALQEEQLAQVQGHASESGISSIVEAEMAVPSPYTTRRRANETAEELLYSHFSAPDFQ